MLTNQTTVIVDITIRKDYIGPGGRTIIIAVAARARKALPAKVSVITMAPKNKDSGVTRMAGAPMFQAVQHPELDTLCLVIIRDFLENRARYLWLVAQNKKFSAARTNLVVIGMTTITVVC
jgi:hypothetical protein